MELRYIHQIWFQGESEIPDNLIPYRESVKRFDKHAIIKLWDEPKINKLIRDHFPKYWTWFYNLELMIHKIDVAKCFILWKHGGVYVDMDIEVLRPLSGLWNPQKIVLGEMGLRSYEHMAFKIANIASDRLINNGIIFSPKGHHFWEYYIDRMKVIIKPPTTLENYIPAIYVMKTTGPVFLTKCVDDYNKGGIKILEPRFLEPQIESFESGGYEDSYIIHHHQASWTELGKVLKYVKKINIKFHVSWILILIIAIVLLLGLLLFRHKKKKNGILKGV